MPQIPRRTRSSKVGTNLQNAAARIERRRKELDARAAKYKKAQAAFRRQRNLILTRPVIRRMAPEVEAVRLAYAHAALAAGGAPAKVARARTRARKAMTAALRKGVPRFRELERQQAAYAKTYGTLVAQDFAADRLHQLPADLGVFVPELPLSQAVTSAYPLFDVHVLEIDEELLIFNESLVEPETGILVTNVQFDHDEHAWGHYNPLRRQAISTSVGLTFTVPQTGPLVCFAVVENLYNKVTCSLSDRFGSSSSHMRADVFLFIEFVRSGESMRSERLMLHNGLQSHGQDFTFSMSTIPDQTPFILTFTPPDAFLKGEAIQVMVGSCVRIQSDTDDMDAFVNAVLMWQVKEIVVGIKA